MNRSAKPKLFLFRMVEADSKLERDEPSILTRVFLMATFVLLVADLLVLAFYFKTAARIADMNRDKFTVDVREAIRVSDVNNDGFAAKIREQITKKNDQIRVFVSEMETSGNRLESQPPGLVGVDEGDLMRLRTLLGKIQAAENPSPVDLHQASSLLSQVEATLNGKLAQQAVLETFVVNFRGVEARVTAFVAEIKKTLEVYLTDILDLAKRQNQNQLALYKRVRGLLTEFDQIYDFVWKKGSYTTLNNFYKSPFLEFENDFIPFSQVAYGKYNAAKLTETSAIELMLPRVYYCTLQAYISGLGNFGVKFEFVDHRPDGSEEVLAATDEILGSYRDPISISEMQTFDLRKGRHNLYLRVLAQRGTSQLRMKDYSHECISYRNFHEAGHAD